MPNDQNNSLNTINNIINNENMHHGFFDTEDLLTYTGNCLGDHDFMNFSLVNRGIFSTLKPDRYKRAGKKLWRAVLGDDSKTAKKILDIYPTLFFLKSQKIFTPIELKSGIKCAYRKIRFNISDETPLTFVLKQNQFVMLSLFTETAVNAGGKNVLLKNDFDEILTQWKSSKSKIKKLNKKPSKHIFSLLLGSLKNEFFVNRVHGKTMPMSDALHISLKHFRNDILCPEEPIKLDEHFDIISLMISCVEVVEEFCVEVVEDFMYLGALESWVIPLYLIYILGHIQSQVNPELAKILCYGGTDDLLHKKKGTHEKNELTLNKFYIPDTVKIDGLGISFFIDVTNSQIINLSFKTKYKQIKSSDYKELKKNIGDQIKNLSYIIDCFYKQHFLDNKHMTFTV